MKHVQMLYNPASGDASFPRKLDQVIERFARYSIGVNVFRCTGPGDIIDFFDSFIPQEGCEAIVVSGGDGSINSVVNGMMKNNINLPLGIIPSGTSNDFANFLKLPMEINASVDIIAKKAVRKIDLGLVNGEYFINVCASGMLVSIAHSTTASAKNLLGNLAYFLKVFEEIPNYTPLDIEITTQDQTVRDKIALFFALNGIGAGGFPNLADAKVDDGLIDLVAIKDMPLHEMIPMFVKILSGKHLNDPNVYYFKEPEFKIECFNRESCICDIDGERGPEFPLEISVCHKALSIIYNKATRAKIKKEHEQAQE